MHVQLPWEIGNAFSAMIKQRRIDVEDAQRGLKIFDSIPLQYVNVDMANVLSIAAHVNAYAYDAYLMDVYTYSEARQNLSSVLKKAESDGKVLIRRKDGKTYALVPERPTASPLDVPSIKADISTQEIVTLVRQERSRIRGWRQRAK